MRDNLVLIWRRVHFRARTRARTWRLVADLVEAGLLLSDALNTAATVAREQGRGVVGDILLDIREGVRDDEFEDRISRYAPSDEFLQFQNMARASAEAVFRAAMRQAELQDKVHRAFRSALAQPLLGFVLLGAVIYMLGGSFFPTMEQISPMSSWPLEGQLIAQFSIWFSANIWIVLIVLGMMIFGLQLTIARWTRAPRQLFDRLPPFSFYKMRTGVSFLLTITELGRMGVTLNSALLDQMAANASPYLRSRITAIAREVQDYGWEEALQATGHDFPGRDLNAVLGVLTQQDNWVEKFSGFLDRWLEDFDTTIKERTAILNVLLMAVIAAAVGGGALSFMSIMQTLSVH
ncbi:type II secretion system F family protein [uncultured Ruegeria sp.]|uniref:type II secretion system F family protein n=1 Tax=uncultured Ruegeria sp. TaxID=259304 RepID=UPI00263A3113|nr:type II secretion system F family protein [uncultured Ruegeria sp.]